MLVFCACFCSCILFIGSEEITSRNVYIGICASRIFLHI